MSTFIIKIIALLTMIIDHSGHVVQRVYGWDAGLILRYIGRIAFPLYAFLLGQGCKNTKNINKYLGRLLLFAFISEIPYDLFRFNIGLPRGMRLSFMDFSSQNVFFTLFLGGLTIAVYMHAKKAHEKHLAAIMGILAMLSAAVAAEILATDYSWSGVMLIAAPVIASEGMPGEKAKKYLYIIFFVACLCAIYFNAGLVMLAFAMISVIFILLYNGERGRSMKWFFYIMYPAHMLALFAIWFFFLRAGEIML